MKIYIKSLGFLLLMIPGFIMAQQEGIATEQVEIIKAFDARLLNTEKYQLAPRLPQLDSTPAIQNYNILARMLNVQYLPPQLKPSTFKPENPATIYNGYGKLGGGFPKAFYVEGGYGIVNEQLELGANLLFNTADNSGDIENQKYTDANVGIEGTYFFDPGYAVSGHLNYNTNRLFYYGYNELAAEEGISRSFASDAVQQHFNTFSLGASIFNGERTEADFNYKASADVYFLRDNYASKENGVKVDLHGKKWFEEAHSFEVNFTADLTSYNDTAKQTLNNYILNPAFRYHSDAFQVKVGVNLTANMDDFNFFPNAELAVNVLGKVLTAYAGVEGNLYKNNYQNLSNYNPFVTERPELRNTNYTNFYGGIKGQYSNISYSAQLGFKSTENLALFLWDGDTIPRFNVVYDSVDIFTISGAISMPIIENLELIGSFQQHFYTTTAQEKAWHLPTLELNAEARYKMMEDKLLLKGAVYVESGVPFLDNDGVAQSLNSLFDLSAGAEYQFTETIGGFIQVNNLLGSNRQRFRYYPIMGLNGVLGLSAKF